MDYCWWNIGLFYDNNRNSRIAETPKSKIAISTHKFILASESSLSSLNSPSTLIPTQKFQALPPTIIPKAEYGQTVVHFKNTQLDNPSLQLRVKSRSWD